MIQISHSAGKLVLEKGNRVTSSPSAHRKCHIEIFEWSQ